MERINNKHRNLKIIFKCSSVRPISVVILLLPNLATELACTAGHLGMRAGHAHKPSPVILTLNSIAPALLRALSAADSSFRRR